jgi:hypothetical protein
MKTDEGCLCCGFPETWDSYYCADCQPPLCRICGLCEACCDCHDEYEDEE